MKVKDLIAALQAFDPDMVVCTMCQDETWCSATEPLVITTAGGFYNLDDAVPRVPHLAEFVAL